MADAKLGKSLEDLIKESATKGRSGSGPKKAGGARAGPEKKKGLAMGVKKGRGGGVAKRSLHRH